MKIMGIDPGMALIGYGLIEIESGETRLLTSGSIRTDKVKNVSARLAEIMQDIEELIKIYNPDVVSIEDLFFFKN